jgi:peptide/nickel transport system substrate-binding protein
MPDDNLNSDQNQPNETPVPQPEVIPPAQNDTPGTTATDIQAPTADATPSVTSTPMTPATESPKKSSKKGLVVAVVLALLAAAGTVWWFTQKKDTNSTQQNNQAQLQEIETLTIGSVEGPASTFFPDEGLQGLYFGLNRQVYEGLVGFTDKKVSPSLAQSWTNPDEKTWIFKLKPNVKFHTGKPVTATEVKASLEDLKNYDYWSLFVSTIESIEVVSDNEVKIVTTKPDALLLNRLSLAFITDLSAKDAAGKNGTGAYMVDSSATNDEVSTTLIPFDDYHGGRATTRKLIYKIFENDADLVKAAKEGQVDIAETLQLPSIKNELSAAGFTSLEYDSPGVFGIYLNQERSATTILKKKEIRQAIAEGVNRQALIDEVGNKNTPATQVVPKSLPGHDTAISFPKENPEAAKQTLAKAGYKNEPLEFAYIAEVQQDAPVLIKQLKAAGFNIREKVYTENQIDSALADLHEGMFDLFAASYSSDFIDARDLLGALLHSSEGSYPVLKDSAYDALLAESDIAFDPIERTKKLQEANKYIADNLLWIPLRNSVYAAYYKPNLQISLDFYGGGNLGAYYRKVGRTAQ